MFQLSGIYYMEFRFSGWSFAVSTDLCSHAAPFVRALQLFVEFFVGLFFFWGGGIEIGFTNKS